MAQGEGFKHISVTPAEEEDVVIRAGVSHEDAVAEPSEPEPELAADPEPQVKPETQAQPQQPQPRPKAQSQPKKRDDYREATLEDLQPQPMSLTHKIVITAAVLCIIGAIVYCFVFLG